MRIKSQYDKNSQNNTRITVSQYYAPSFMTLFLYDNIIVSLQLYSFNCIFYYFRLNLQQNTKTNRKTDYVFIQETKCIKTNSFNFLIFPLF